VHSATQPDAHAAARSASRQRSNGQATRKKSAAPVLIILFVLLAGALALFGVILAQNVLGHEGEDSPVKSPPFMGSTDTQTQPEPTKTYTISLDTGEYPDAVVFPVGGASAEQEGLVTGADGQEGLSTSLALKVPFGTPITALPYLKVEGMRFTGWWTGLDSDENAQRIDNNSLSLLALDTDVTLHARFEPKPSVIDYESSGVPIFMYHYFYDPELGETGEDANWLDIHLFEEQLAWLRDNNYYYPTWEEVNEYLRGNITLPEKSVVLTSDDGNESFYRLAIPLVEQYGARITSFVVATDFDPENLGRYDRSRIFFQSHSFDMHRGGSDGDARILTSSYDEIVADVQAGDQVLGTRTVYCYPFGKTDENAKQALSDSNVQIALVIENVRAYPMMDMMGIPRLRISDGISLDVFISEVNP
jgi:peptidoglycan/xylan/chitin deacetylase (PgdA/CDA1 family)